MSPVVRADTGSRLDRRPPPGELQSMTDRSASALRAAVGLPASPAPLVVAEVGQAHDGSLGTAHAFIDVIARSGADAVKFQTHIAAAESTRGEPWRVRFSLQDDSRYDYWRRMEFTPTQWEGLRDHARDAGLVFMSTPFSAEAVALLDGLEVPAWKVASGETSNTPLIALMARTGRPVFLSSGMSDYSEIGRAVDIVRSEGALPVTMQCTTAYPTAPEDVGLNVLAELHDRFDCPTGLSDHSGTIFPALAAATLGATVLEVHVTLSADMFGPDVPASLTPDDLQRLVTGTRAIAAMLSSPIDKDARAADSADLRAMFTKSVVAVRDMPAETILTATDVTLKKPGGGLGPDRFEEVMGRRTVRALRADEPIGSDDLDPVLERS